MHTLEILHEQRKSIETRLICLQEELDDVQFAIRALEGRRNSRQAPGVATGPKPVIAPELRPRPASNG